MEELELLLHIYSSIYHVGKDLTMAGIRIANVIRNADWHGKQSYERLQRTCGSDVTYFDINSQDAETLKNTIGDTMGKYGIGYAELPDLNVQDGHFQIAVDARNTESLKAALNEYNGKKLEKLNEAKKQHGEGTKEYEAAKAQIEKEMPTIKSMTADEYAYTRFDAEGKETNEYQDLERSARENIEKMPEAKMSEQDLTTEEKVEIIRDEKLRATQEDMIKSGRAEKIEVTDIKQEPFEVNGEKVPLYRARIDDEKSLILSKSSIIDDKHIMLEPAKKYIAVGNKSGTMMKMTGREASQAIKAAAKAIKEALKQTAKAVKQAATKSNPYSGIASAAVEVTVGAVKAGWNAGRDGVIDSVRHKKAR